MGADGKHVRSIRWRGWWHLTIGAARRQDAMDAAVGLLRDPSNPNTATTTDKMA